jgi:peptide-methionine (S)-S-oxide reductase
VSKTTLALSIVALICLGLLTWSNGLLGTPHQASATKPHTFAAVPEPSPGTRQATFAEGCFWSNQAMFKQLKGVSLVLVGYSGGETKMPSYEDVCSGTTGHAESVQIVYDPKIISYGDLLDVFWHTHDHTHDPTTLNRQGHDVGTQYRSVIFYRTPEEKEAASESKNKLEKAGAFADPIVTEIVPFTEFYPAEEYHQDYYVNHLREPYCVFVIQPKLEKFANAFKEKIQAP